MKNNWQNNLIQFPRLISELQMAGAFTPDIMESLMESMDLTNEEVCELIDRAEIEWQEIKKNT